MVYNSVEMTCKVLGPLEWVTFCVQSKPIKFYNVVGL